MTTEGRPNTPSYSSSSWGGLVAASARRADGRPSKDKDATHDPEIGTTALSGATLAELRESIAALSDQVAALAENDEKARRLTLQLGMDVVQMGGALSRRVRTLEQQIAPEPAPEPIPAHDPSPRQPLAEAATHERPAEAMAAPVAEAAEITTSVEPPLEESVDLHQASVSEAAAEDEPVSFAEPANAEANETIEAEPVEAPLVLDSPNPPIFDHSEVSSYPLRAPETTSAELFAPRPTVSKKSPIPVTTLAIVGGVVVAIIGAAVVFLTGQHHAPAHVAAAPPPAATPTPAPVAAAPAPKPAPAPAPAAPKSDSSSSHKHSDKYGSRHHHGDRDSRGGGKSDGHVLYDITPPAAPASTPAPF